MTAALTDQPITHGSWLEITSVDEIPLRGARRIMLGDQKIALFRCSEGKVYALANACPHKGGPLSEGIVHGNCVTCPLHNWVISLETGSAMGADEGTVNTYPVKIENNRVYLFI